MQNADVQSGKF